MHLYLFWRSCYNQKRAFLASGSCFMWTCKRHCIADCTGCAELCKNRQAPVQGHSGTSALALVMTTCGRKGCGFQGSEQLYQSTELTKYSRSHFGFGPPSVQGAFVRPGAARQVDHMSSSAMWMSSSAMLGR